MQIVITLQKLPEHDEECLVVSLKSDDGTLEDFDWIEAQRMREWLGIEPSK